MLRLRNKTLLIYPWGGFGLPKGGDGFISSPFGPVIPRRVALQQSPLLFDRTAESEGQEHRGQASGEQGFRLGREGGQVSARFAITTKASLFPAGPITFRPKRINQRQEQRCNCKLRPF